MPINATTTQAAIDAADNLYSKLADMASGVPTGQDAQDIDAAEGSLDEALCKVATIADRHNLEDQKAAACAILENRGFDCPACSDT